MKLKHAILAVIDRDNMKEVVDDLKIEEIDRRSVDEMGAKISRCSSITPEQLLAYLSEAQIKSVCEEIGVPSLGRRKTLIRRLLANHPKKPKTPKKRKEKPIGKLPKVQTIKRPKESSIMTESNSSPAISDADDITMRLPDPPPGMMRINKTELVCRCSPRPS